MEKKVKHINLTVDDVRNVKTISFVKDPAMEAENFYYFSKDVIEEFNKVGEKGLVSGLAMRPDKVIDRINKKTGEKYTVSFDKDTVERSSQLFLKQDRQKSSNLEHKYEIDGVCVVESWIIRDEKMNNSIGLGFKDVKEGDWWVTYKVENEDLKKMIKAGDVTGFSVEGAFIDAILSKKEEDEFNKMSKESFTLDKRCDKLLEFIENNLSDVDLCLSKLEMFKRTPPLHENCKCEIVDGKWITHPEDSDGGVCDGCKDQAREYNAF